jgi:hypothetical protein
MSRVARSARVGSRQRPEAVASNKTITAAESGEVYIVSGSSAVTLTLPRPQEGSYYKFIYGPGMTQNMKVAGQDGDLFIGFTKQIVGAGESITVTAANGSSNDALTLAGGASAGSYIECFSEGTVWFVDGIATGSAYSFSNS